MKIKMAFDVLDSMMMTVATIFSDRALQDDLKNVVIWRKDGKVYLAAYGGTTLSATEVTAEVTLDANEVDEPFVQLRAKDISDILSSLKGLKRTYIRDLEFDILPNEAILHVFEEPIDSSLPNSDSYRQESKFRITKPVMKDLVKSEISKINVNLEGEPISSGELLIYINALLPTVAKETREATNNILFSKDHVFTFLAPYTAIMDNRLPEALSGFRLSNTTVFFIKNFIQNEETFLLSKEIHANGMVVLTIRAGASIAVIKCADMSRAYDISNFLSLPSNGVVIDKIYLMDVLKRMSLSSDATGVAIDIEPTGGSMRVFSKTMTQHIPVSASKGEGSFHFQIKADLLSTVIFSHMPIFGETVFLYLEHGDRGNIVLGVKDNLNLWHTKLTGLAPIKGDFAWVS